VHFPFTLCDNLIRLAAIICICAPASPVGQRDSSLCHIQDISRVGELSSPRLGMTMGEPCTAGVVRAHLDIPNVLRYTGLEPDSILVAQHHGRKRRSWGRPSVVAHFRPRQHVDCLDKRLWRYPTPMAPWPEGEIVAAPTDEQLMAQLQQGYTGALDELYRRHARGLYAFCRNLAPTSYDPEDLVQDVFVRVIKSARTFDPRRASFRTWLYRIARNRSIDLARRATLIRFLPIGRRGAGDEWRQETVSEDALIDDRQDVEALAAQAATTNAVRDCIDRLEHREEKQAFLLYHLSGMVYREIGELLGKSTSMARNRVKAAQDKVKKCLEGKGIASAT
jgi:RNA polymerase sigma-70 factor (ECF subfamily)